METRRLADFALLAVLAACEKPPTGTELKFHAPGIGGTLTVVLVDPTASMPLHQRTSPATLTDSDVVYYKQAVMAGTFDQSFADLDNAVIELGSEPGAGTAHYVAFAIVGPLSAPTAIGTFVDSTGAPAAIELPPADSGKTEQFGITLEPVAPPNTDGSIGQGEYELVTCAQATTPSGFVWHRMASGELRVLLSDDGDALMRALDLDCDGDNADAAVAPDCDDTRASFYAGAVETCDGQDTNCDGQLLPVATACTVANDPACPTGVQYCNDVANGAPGSCLPAASCAQNDAFACDIVDQSSNSIYSPCADNVAQLDVSDLVCSVTPCVISVARSADGWRTSLATSEPGAGALPLPVITVTTDSFWIEVTLTGTFSGTTSMDLGEVDLAVVRQGMPITNIGVALDTGEQGQCAPVPTEMSCSQTTH